MTNSAGQDFWHFLSGDDRLYIDIVQPLGHEAKTRNQEFVDAYSQILNRAVFDFTKQYCNKDGAINWEALVKLNSERTIPQTG